MFDIKSFRKGEKLRQVEVADVLGCTQSHYSCIEAGTRNLTEEQFSKLLAFYGPDTINKYSCEDEPYTQVVNINKANGNDNRFSNGDYYEQSNQGYLEIIKEQSRQITRFQQQIDRLLTLLENK